MPDSSLAVIGIDGGSWNVLRKLISNGDMPWLKEMIKKGVYGDLRSTIPPITGAAWLAIATGLNPGKTGVVDFFKHEGNFVFRIVNSADYRDKSVWDYLSLLNYRIAILDYPLLYPPYPINGIIISSWGPKLLTYPASLINEIQKIVGKYDIIVNYHLEKYDDINLFIEDLNRAVEKKLKISRQILRKKWDLFIDVLSFTDWLQHRMWHYIDESHPMHLDSSSTSVYRRKFADFWRIVDEYLKEVSNIYDNVIVISDHGFGPQWGVFNLATWSIKHGFVKLRNKGFNSIKARSIRTIIKIVNRLKIYKAIPKSLRYKARKTNLRLKNPFLYIDPARSEIIVVPDYTIPFGAIHVNPLMKGKKDEILRKILDALNNIGNEFNNKLKITSWKVQEIYWGSKLSLLPDIVFTINDWSCVVVKDFTKEFVYKNEPYSLRHTGSHRLYGIFVGWGEGIRKGFKLNGCSVLDVAPTILYMLKAPIPADIDGKPLIDITVFKDKREPIYVNPSYYTRLKIAKRIREKAGVKYYNK